MLKSGSGERILGLYYDDYMVQILISVLLKDFILGFFRLPLWGGEPPQGGFTTKLVKQIKKIQFSSSKLQLKITFLQAINKTVAAVKTLDWKYRPASLFNKKGFSTVKPF